MRTPITLLVTLLLGCAGGETGPTSLQYTLEDRVISSATPGERSGIDAARAEWGAAQHEQARQQAALEEADTKHEAARAEASRYSAELEGAGEARERASGSNDPKARNDAERDYRWAELANRAARAKVSLALARYEWAQREVAAATEDVLAKEARVELEKARLARSKYKISNAELHEYERQQTSQLAAFQSARRSADAAKARVGDKERELAQREAEYEAARNPSVGSPLSK